MTSTNTSPRTEKYLKALDEEGDNFDYRAWLRRVREEEARETGISAPESASGPSIRSSMSLKSSTSVSQTPSITYTSANPPKDRGYDLAIRRRLVKVCNAWDRFQDNKRRDAVYGYLKSVFRIVMQHSGKRRMHKLLRRACKFAKLPYYPGVEPFATIIRCTSARELDTKTISKWARALRYAAYRCRPPRTLKSFIQAMGGINVCADRYSSRLGRTAQKD